MNIKDKIKIFFLINNQLKKENMKNWKTSLLGTLSGLCILLSGNFPEYKELLISFSGLALALLGYFSKDKNVTGGSTEQ